MSSDLFLKIILIIVFSKETKLYKYCRKLHVKLNKSDLKTRASELLAAR